MLHRLNHLFSITVSEVYGTDSNLYLPGFGAFVLIPTLQCYSIVSVVGEALVKDVGGSASDITF